MKVGEFHYSNLAKWSRASVRPKSVRHFAVELQAPAGPANPYWWSPEEFVAELNFPQKWVNPNERVEVEELLSILCSIRDKARKEEPCDEEMQQANDMLAQCSSVMEIMHVDRGGQLYYWQSPRERNPLALVARLIQGDLINRVRRCTHCNKWFFAKTDKANNIYCSVECQQAHWRSTPEFKESNRKYQRKYYHDVLSPKTGREFRRKQGRKR